MIPIEAYYLGAGLVVLWLFSRVRGRRRRPAARSPVREVVASLGCTEAQAGELLAEYQGNPDLVIMEVKRGARSLSQPVAGGWVVMVTELGAVTPNLLLQALTEASGMSTSEAASRLSSGGVVAQALEQPVAERFAELLVEQGVSALALSSGEVITPHFAGDLRSFEFSDQHLVLKTNLGRYLVPWDSVAYLTLGCLRGNKNRAEKWVEAHKGEILGFLYGKSEDRWLRFAIEGSKMSFAGISSASGGWTKSNSVDNLRVWIEELSKRSPLKHPLDRFVEERKLPLYNRPQDMESESLAALHTSVREKK